MPVMRMFSPEELSTTLTLEIGSIVGGRLTGGRTTTVTVKAWLKVLLICAPLFTVTVTVAEPRALVRGANVKVAELLGLE